MTLVMTVEMQLVWLDKKAANYTHAKLTLNYFEVVFSALVLLAWTLGGGLNWLDGFWHSLSDNILFVGVGFILSLMLIGSLIDLPFSLYRTFVLEEKFGFNKTTISTLISDTIKGLGLALVIGVPLLYVVLYLMNEMGEYWWFFVWLVLTGFSLLMLWLIT
jgi:STE24 endopeptidase